MRVVHTPEHNHYRSGLHSAAVYGNTALGIVSDCLLVMLPAMELFYVSDLMRVAKNLLIGNVIKVQFLNIHDWPFGGATSITLNGTDDDLLAGFPFVE